MTENQKIQASNIPTIGDRQIDLLEKLCNASAVSGDEQEVRNIVLEEIKPVIPHPLPLSGVVGLRKRR